MKVKSFSPILAPNEEIKLSEISYPLLASYKLDGCRLLIRDGKYLTRSLKDLPNKQLREKFEALRKFTEDKGYTLDGEVYAPGIPFQFIVSCFMTEDFNTKEAEKKWAKLCEEEDFDLSRQEVFNQLKFHCFDTLDEGMIDDLYFEARVEVVQKLAEDFKTVLTPDLFVAVKNIVVNNEDETQKYFEQAVETGLEGLILRNPRGFYKYGRCTIKEANVYKLKPWVTEDAKIVGILQATEVNEDAEKKINELGRSVTSKKQGDRHTIEKAQAFIVDFHGENLTVPLKMTDEKKKYVWNNQAEYLGKYVEFKYMKIGMKKDGLPRIPKFIRMRPDKD